MRVRPEWLHPPGNPYHRFTRPTRDIVIVADCDPRDSTTRVFASPQPSPQGSKVTTGLDTVSATRCWSGPGP